MLEDVSEIICGSCGGKCCSNFPVFIKDREHNRMFQNPTYYDDVTGMATLMCSAKLANTYACYYHAEGGCPESMRPDLCNNWFCSLWDEFVTGALRPFTTGSEAKWITRHIMEVSK